MPKQKLLSEEFVKRCIIQWLSCNGWGANLQFGGLRDRGVDIKVKNSRYGIYFLIECKGEGRAKGSKEVAFVYSLGQIITRMSVAKAKYKYGLGLSESSTKIALRRLPWQVAKKLNLYVFSVDEKGRVKQLSWKELKKKQK